MKKILPVICLLVLFSCRKAANTGPDTLPDSYSNQSVGASAHDLLSSTKYTSVTIELQYMPGFAPDATALSNITSFLNTYCNKPGGVTITQSQIAANGDSLTTEKVAIIEAQNRKLYTTGNTLALYVLITDGYDTGKNILGFAYRNTSLSLMGKAIFDHSGGFGQVSRTELESGVLEHELGHILELVNLGSPMGTPHQDTPHGNHCTNTKCLMYYEMETSATLASMLMNSVPSLDSNCVGDLRANGGK